MLRRQCIDRPKPKEVEREIKMDLLMPTKKD